MRIRFLEDRPTPFQLLKLFKSHEHIETVFDLYSKNAIACRFKAYRTNFNSKFLAVPADIPSCNIDNR